MAVLEQAGDSWEVVCESEGLSTEVSQVQTVSLREDAAQLVVGYANSNLTDKYLTIYSYGGGQLVMEYQQACEAFLIADLNSDGASEVYLRFLYPSCASDELGRGISGCGPCIQKRKAKRGGSRR